MVVARERCGGGDRFIREHPFSGPQTVNVTLTVADTRGAVYCITRPVVVGGGADLKLPFGVPIPPISLNQVVTTNLRDTNLGPVPFLRCNTVRAGPSTALVASAVQPVT